MEESEDAATGTMIEDDNASARNGNGIEILDILFCHQNNWNS
jgi:hypothetical protein